MLASFAWVCLLAAGGCSLFTDLDGLSTGTSITLNDGGPGDLIDAQAFEAAIDADAGEPNVSACRSPHTFCTDFDVSTDPGFGFSDVSSGIGDSLTTSDTAAWSNPRAMLAQAGVTTQNADHSAFVAKNLGGAQTSNLAFRMRVEADNFDTNPVTIATINVYSSTEGQRALQVILDHGRIVLRVDVYDQEAGTISSSLTPSAAFVPGEAWHSYALAADFALRHTTLTVDGAKLVTSSIPGSAMPDGISLFAGIWYARASKPWSLRFDDIAIDMK
ncbi:MAG: hypothetical protein ABI461_15090 [Polyangiaceae bacterium]